MHTVCPGKGFCLLSGIPGDLPAFDAGKNSLTIPNSFDLYRIINLSDIGIRIPYIPSIPTGWPLLKMCFYGKADFLALPKSIPGNISERPLQKPFPPGNIRKWQTLYPGYRPNANESNDLQHFTILGIHTTPGIAKSLVNTYLGFTIRRIPGSIWSQIHNSAIYIRFYQTIYVWCQLIGLENLQETTSRKQNLSIIKCKLSNIPTIPGWWF